MDEITVSTQPGKILLTQPIYGKKLKILLKDTTNLGKIARIKPQIFDSNDVVRLNIYDALRGYKGDNFQPLKEKKFFISVKLKDNSLKKVEVARLTVSKAESQYHSPEVVGELICGNCIGFKKHPHCADSYYEMEACVAYSPKTIDFTNRSWGASDWELLGSDMLLQNRIKDALNCYENAAELDPLNAKYWNVKAVILIQLGRTQEAQKCQKRALSLGLDRDPKEWVKGGLKLVEFMQSLGFKFQESSSLFANSRYNPVEFYEEKKERRDALRKAQEKAQKIQAEMALKIRAQVNSFIEQAQNEFESKNFEKAVENCEEALKLDTRCNKSWEILQKIYRNHRIKKICGACRSYKLSHCKVKDQNISFFNQKANSCFYFLRTPSFV